MRFTCKIRVGKLTSINEQEINAKIASFVLHVSREGNKITPVSTIVLLFQVPFQPAMRIRLRQLAIAYVN